LLFFLPFFSPIVSPVCMTLVVSSSLVCLLYSSRSCVLVFASTNFTENSSHPPSIAPIRCPTLHSPAYSSDLCPLFTLPILYFSCVFLVGGFLWMSFTSHLRLFMFNFRPLYLFLTGFIRRVTVRWVWQRRMGTGTWWPRCWREEQT